MPKGRKREQRQAPTPAQDEGQLQSRASSPAAVWGNPAAAPPTRAPPEPGKTLQRERQDEDDDSS